MSDFQLNIPIAKVDEEQRIVYGYATQEVLDRQGDIVDYEASKKAFSAWPGNIREQHDNKRAVGKNVHLEFDDDEKRVLIGAKISESADGQNAFTKVKEGILTGFSIGGKIYKTIRDTAKNAKGEDVGANRIIDYELAEVSLVDVPACPTAQFVMVKSLDGELQQVEEMREDLSANSMWFNKAFAYSPSQVNRKSDVSDNTSMSKQSKESDMSKDELEKTVAAPAEDAPVEQTEQKVEKVNVQGGEERDANAQPVKPVENEETPVDDEPVQEEKPSKKKKADEATETKVETAEVAKSHDNELKKGFYTVSELADCISCLTWIVGDAEFDAMYGESNGEAAGKLKAAVAQVADALVELTQEAVADLKSGDDVELADKPADLKKMVSDVLEATQPDLVKSVVEAVSAKVTEQLKPLEERLKTIENQPAGQAPVRNFTVVDKVADSQPSELESLIAKSEEVANDPMATPADRTALALQILKAQARK